MINLLVIFFTQCLNYSSSKTAYFLGLPLELVTKILEVLGVSRLATVVFLRAILHRLTALLQSVDSASSARY